MDKEICFIVSDSISKKSVHLCAMEAIDTDQKKVKKKWIE